MEEIVRSSVIVGGAAIFTLAFALDAFAEAKASNAEILKREADPSTSFGMTKSVQDDKGHDIIKEGQGAREANIAKAKDYISNHDKITNNEIEKLLGISDATAERYLNELEKEGLIKQVGKTGMKTYYEKV